MSDPVPAILQTLSLICTIEQWLQEKKISILQIKKLRVRETARLSWGYTASLMKMIMHVMNKIFFK